MIGFNRRFSPHAKMLKEYFAKRTLPLVLQYRVNAGSIPKDVWIQDPQVGGGRMVGGDHFALPREGGEDPGEVIASFMTQYYDQAGLIPRNVLCQTLPEGAREQLRKEYRFCAVARPVKRYRT